MSEKSKKNFSQNKGDLGEVVIGGAITLFAVCGAIYTGNPVAYGAMSLLALAEASTVQQWLAAQKSNDGAQPV